MKRKQLCLITATLSSSLLISTSFAAQLIDVSKQPVNSFASFFTANNPTRFALLSEHVDFNGTNHTRLQETYLGYPVFGADIVVHVSNSNHFGINQLNDNTTMNGIIYQQLNNDLLDAPNTLFAEQNAKRAQDHAISLYQKNTAVTDITDTQSHAIVYVDKQNVGHWAYQVTFDVNVNDGLPARPVYIMDAKTLAIYEQWDNIQTANGGGYGGNQRIGQITYDGLPGDLPMLKVTRTGKTCYAKNSIVRIINLKTNADSSYACAATDPNHNNTYWNGSLDQVNGGFSPSNDALYGMQNVNQLYKSWMKVPVLTDNGKPMLLVGRVHANMDNAYWDGRQMTYGDGINYFYPLTSLDVMGHEISHGFTQQHSGLIYRYQSGGINEAYSDIAGEATKYFVNGKNDFIVGSSIVKNCSAKLCGLRSMIDPTVDGRSIDHTSKYKDGIDVHYSSGIFNKAFYLLASTSGWNTQKAFKVMAKANMDYWTSNASFESAGCGVVHAASDYQYSVTDVHNALSKVGINATSC